MQQTQKAEESLHIWRLLKPTRSSRTTILLRRHLSRLSLVLEPLVSVKTGQAHPDFPKTLLHYHILTEEQLDDLAHFYHQRTPSALSFRYPEPIVWRWNSNADIEDKRRRFGRFIGFRGCDSPDVVDNSSHDELVFQRWYEEKIRQTVDREQVMSSWKAKGF